MHRSNLLNISFDPSIPEVLASCSYDDDGRAARKKLLIRDGLLLRPFGGALSQQHSSLGGIANSRACNWNHVPTDHMVAPMER